MKNKKTPNPIQIGLLSADQIAKLAYFSNQATVDVWKKLVENFCLTVVNDSMYCQ